LIKNSQPSKKKFQKTVWGEFFLTHTVEEIKAQCLLTTARCRPTRDGVHLSTEQPVEDVIVSFKSRLLVSDTRLLQQICA